MGQWHKETVCFASLVTLTAGVMTTGQVSTHQVGYSEVDSVLRAHCTKCHSGETASASLRLDSFEGLLMGGTSGPVVVPKNVRDSLIIKRVRGEGGMQQMPPGFVPLSAREQKILTDWIEQGASKAQTIRKHWAYVAPVRPPLPKTKQLGWAKNPIDAFVLSRLEREGLKPSEAADKTTLIRRVTLDLTGLPPTIEEIDAFLADKSPLAYDRVVDRLLSSPHYGEKMALPWLDAARYADSNGFQQDGDNYQWVWRDWVVRAMNDNMPFDRFTVLQLAGDLLPGVTQATSEGRSALVATAFNRNHMLNGEGGAIPEEQRNVGLFDRVETTATTWLGLTMTCARCHDHKYDPISMRDYYSLMAYFNRVPETGVPEGGVPYSIGKPWIFAGSDDQMRLLFALETRAAKSIATKSPDAEDLTKELNDLKSQIPRVMVMSDRLPRRTHILNRGNYEEPLGEVAPGTPGVLPKPTSSKDRLGLANWIVSSNNPLTARVQVNRYWQTFFGRGLVDTPENFGVQGSAPTHPDLLDWLAVEFVESGWDVKRFHRLIVTSATYRQSSKVSPTLFKKDPANTLLARGARFRMPSMVLRDVALASSGLMNDAIGGKPVYPYQPKGIWDALAVTEERNFAYPQSKGRDLYRRSIYSFWRRTAVPGNMFDAASRQVCTVREYRTSTPLHALTMLNDPTWVEAGRALAERVMKLRPNKEERLRLAFKLLCSRYPDKTELRILTDRFVATKEHFTKNGIDAEQLLSVGESPRDSTLDPAEHAAMATVCHMLYNLDEAMTRE